MEWDIYSLDGCGSQGKVSSCFLGDRKYNSADGLSAGKQKLTKFSNCAEHVQGSLPSSPAQEPGNEANNVDTFQFHTVGV